MCEAPRPRSKRPSWLTLSTERSGTPGKAQFLKKRARDAGTYRDNLPQINDSQTDVKFLANDSPPDNDNSLLLDEPLVSNDTNRTATE